MAAVAIEDQPWSVKLVGEIPKAAKHPDLRPPSTPRTCLGFFEHAHPLRETACN